jgi:hypothetical protein
VSLLLGASGKAHVVVMTDGISIFEDRQTRKVERRDLQKVFASNSKPCVVAQHGQNKPGTISCASLLPDLIEDELDRVWSRGLNVVAARAIEALDNVVAQHLKTGPGPMPFGWWLARQPARAASWAGPLGRVQKHL